MSLGSRKIFKMKRNDTLPALKAIITDKETGDPVDLTGASVKFIMVTNDDARTVKVNAAATITDATAGTVQYNWTSGDTDTAGNYLGEFETTPASGGKFTLPTDDSLEIVIVEDYDNA